MLLVIYGQNISFSKRLIPGFAVCAVLMILIPLAANVGGSTGWYLMVVAMLVLGVANGASQISAFTMAAAFPQ